MAVSYTHLDVYKRQPSILSLIFSGSSLCLLVFFINPFDGFFHSLELVSNHEHIKLT